MMKYMSILIFTWIMAYSNVSKSQTPDNMIAVLDTIWQTEQEPIRLRDSLMKIYGADSDQFREQQEFYQKNHAVNEQKVKDILDTYGWPSQEMICEHGNWTICNVIQHSENAIRLKYLPMMQQAVKDKKLEPRFLVEQRIELQQKEVNCKFMVDT